MDIDRPRDDDEATATDDLEVPTADADAVTGGILILGRDDDPVPEHECK